MKTHEGYRAAISSIALQPTWPGGAPDPIRFLRHTGATCGDSISIGDLRRLIATYERRFPSGVSVGGVTSTWTMLRIDAASR
jgi:hypothetical protein